MVVNESFIDSATLRENVVSLARNIGYVPRSKRAAKATVSFQLAGISSSTNYADHDNHTYGTHPNVAFKGGSGYGAVGTVTISGNNINNISMTTPGYGYKIGDNLTIDNDSIGG